jgi:hypothetical protein
MSAKKPIRYCKTCNIPIRKCNKYDYCRACYNNSPEIKEVCEKIFKNRPDYNGENNPHYRGGKIDKVCPCGVVFEVFPARKDTAKYCSRECKKKYSVSLSKIYEYKGLRLRSSWELAFAQYLDSKNYNWKYEPETFETSCGFYTPDFWVDEFSSYFEVKGFFRKDAEQKFNEFKENHPIVLANKEYLLSLGFVRIKSGPRKNQLCPPVQQP